MPRAPRTRPHRRFIHKELVACFDRRRKRMTAKIQTRFQPL